MILYRLLSYKLSEKTLQLPESTKINSRTEANKSLPTSSRAVIEYSLIPD